MHRLERVLLTAVLIHFRYLLLFAATFTCKTPLDIRDTHGVETDKLPGSRIEYDPFPGRFVITPGQNIYLEFRTWSPTGLVFLTGDFKHEEFVGAYLTRGFLTFARRCGNGRAFEMYRNRLDDGKWHSLKYIHSFKGGILLIDGKDPFRRYHMGPCKHFKSVLFGGLSPKLALGRLSGNDEHHRFSGCLRNMRIDGMVPTIHPTYIAVSQCDHH